MRVWWWLLMIGFVCLLPAVQVISIKAMGRSTEAYVAEHLDLLVESTVIGLLLGGLAIYKLSQARR